MSILDALLPIAAGWSRGAMQRQRDDDERAERDERREMERERLDMARAAEARAAAAETERRRIAGEDRARELHDAGYRDAAPIQARGGAAGLDLQRAMVDPTLGADARTSLLSKAAAAIAEMGRHRGVPGVEGKLLDPEATPDARSARAAAAAAAAKASEAEQAHARRLAEIRLREELTRARPRTPPNEPQGSIIQAEDGSYWRVVNGVPQPLTRPDGSPLKAPPKGSGGPSTPIAAVLDRLRGTPPAAPTASGDTAPAPALAPSAQPTPAQAAKYRELRSRGIAHAQAMAEAMQVR